MSKNTHYLCDEALQRYRCALGIRTNELEFDATLFEQLLKQRGAIAMGGKPVCELGTVICLNAFNLEFEGFKHILQEDSRGKGTQLIEAFNVPKA